MTIRAAIIDLDGTVYRGGRPIPGAAEAVERLREADLSVLFVSNNPTKPPAAFASDLEALGIPAAPADVLTSADVTREYLAADHADDLVFPIVDEAVTAQLSGIALTESPVEADVVLVGYDRAFDYDDMVDGLRALADGETAFVGTDPDVTIPTADGTVPGSGAIVRAIAGVTERDPDRVLGKPSRETVEAARARLGVDPGSWLVVGDRLDTDVALGDRVGAVTVLVRTGTHDEADVGAGTPSPDHVVDSIASVPDLL